MTIESPSRIIEYYKYFKLVAALHRHSKKELIELLLEEKARLHFLMMKDVKTETGPLATTISIIDGNTKTKVRYFSIRRAIDELAQSVLGAKWIRRMIVHGITHEFEDSSDQAFFDLPPTSETVDA